MLFLLFLAWTGPRLHQSHWLMVSRGRTEITFEFSSDLLERKRFFIPQI